MFVGDEQEPSRIRLLDIVSVLTPSVRQSPPLLSATIVFIRASDKSLPLAAPSAQCLDILIPPLLVAAELLAMVLLKIVISPLFWIAPE